jgi:hypothetical protein
VKRHSQFASRHGRSGLVGGRTQDNATEEKRNMDLIWKQKGATLSDKSARQEFGLTQQEIYEAMRAGKLHFQQNSMHGNPWFRLLRHEVEALVREKSGKDGLHRKKLEKELADLEREARKIKSRLKAVERRQAELTEELGE